MARVLVFVSDLSDIIANTEPPSAAIRWGASGDRDTLVAAGVSANWLSWAIDHGARFVVAEEDGRIVGHNIFLTGDSVRQYDWLLIRLNAKQDVFSTSSFVVAERRGHRVFASMKRFAAQHLAEQGYRRMVSVVETNNEASIRAHRRIGAVCWTKLRRTRVGRLRLVWQGRALRHIRLGAEPFRVSV